jgi:predicted permease
MSLRTVLRAAARSPRFSLAIILVTATTIALASTAWVLLGQVVFQPLPYPSAGQLVAIWNVRPDDGPAKVRVSGASYQAWRERQTAFSHMAVLAYAQARLLGQGEPLALRGAEVTDEFFPLLGVRPALGRLPSPADYRADAAHVVVVSDRLWRTAFHGDRAIIGKTIRLDLAETTVIGVLPPVMMPMTAWAAGRLEMKADAPFFWRPRLVVKPTRSGVLGVIARVRPQSSVRQARAQLEQIAATLARENPDTNRGVGVAVVPLADEAAPPLVRRGLWMVAAGALLLVLLACANMAGLFLLRALERQRGLAVRAALGASIAQLWRLLFAELATLSAAGVVLSIPIGLMLARALQSMPGIDLAQWSAAGLQPRLIATAAILGISLAAVASLGPLFFLRGFALDSALRTRDASVSLPMQRARQLLVGAEMALAVVLLVGAALLGRSLLHIRAVDPRFRAEQVATMRLDLPAYRYAKMSDVQQFWPELQRRLEALPEVERAGGVYDLPIEANWLQSFSITGEAEPLTGARSALYRTVTPGAMETLRMRLDRGRFFTDADRSTAGGVAIVNESFVRGMLGGREAIGRQLELSTIQWQWGDAVPRRFRIVGVVGDVHFNGLTGGSAPALYLSHTQTPHTEMQLVVRTKGDPAAARAGIRRVIHELDPQLPVGELRLLSDAVDESIARPRLYARLFTAFAAIAALLALVGLGTVLSQSLREQARGLAVRAAVGATARDLFAHGLGTGLRPVLGGVACGLFLAALSGRTLQSLLFELEPLNAVTFASVALLTFAGSAVICAIPARAAARVSPMRVLREE